MVSLLKSIVEPAVIAALFTLGALLNRRQYIRKYDIESTNTEEVIYDSSTSSASSSSDSSTEGLLSQSEGMLSEGLLVEPPSKNVGTVRIYRQRRTGLAGIWELVGRFWDKYPFLEEIWYWNLTYWYVSLVNHLPGNCLLLNWGYMSAAAGEIQELAGAVLMMIRVYQLMRAWSATSIANQTPIFDLARTHALQLLSLESRLGIAIELSLQRNILNHHPHIMPILERVYHAHICVGVAFIVYTYTYTPRSAYIRVRRALALDNALAFVLFTAWRCMPPRLLPSGYGYIDILHGKSNKDIPGVGGEAGTSGTTSTGGNVWTENRFRLTIAAMPSLHFGTACLLGWFWYRYAPHTLVRRLAPLWPAVMALTVLATANHFVLDLAAGVGVVVLGWRFGRVVRWLGVLQRWILRPVRRKMGVQETFGWEKRWSYREE